MRQVSLWASPLVLKGVWLGADKLQPWAELGSRDPSLCLRQPLLGAKDNVLGTKEGRGVGGL